MSLFNKSFNFYFSISINYVFKLKEKMVHVTNEIKKLFKLIFIKKLIKLYLNLYHKFLFILNIEKIEKMLTYISYLKNKF